MSMVQAWGGAKGAGGGTHFCPSSSSNRKNLSSSGRTSTNCFTDGGTTDRPPTWISMGLRSTRLANASICDPAA